MLARKIHLENQIFPMYQQEFHAVLMLVEQLHDFFHVYDQLPNKDLMNYMLWIEYLKKIKKYI